MIASYGHGREAEGVPMTDKELLEFAAKSAGVDVHFDATQWDRFWVNGGGFWNPLADDGDAFRLMVKLDLSSVMVFPSAGKRRREFWTPNSRSDGGHSVTADAEYTADPYAATRRAIVRAAAEIGKGMK